MGSVLWGEGERRLQGGGVQGAGDVAEEGRGGGGGGEAAAEGVEREGVHVRE